MKTSVQAAMTSVFGLVAFMLMVFVPAGTFDYWRGWAFIAVFAAATLIPSVYLAVKNPDALRRRMQAGPGAETRPLQKLIIVVAFVSVISMIVISALDFRFGWSAVPAAGFGAGTRPRSSGPDHLDAGDDSERLCRSQYHRRV